MPTYLDLESWPRRPHFDFFRSYDVAVLGRLRRGRRGSALADPLPRGRRPSVHPGGDLPLLAGGQRGREPPLPASRRAGAGARPVIHGSSTILRPNETFGFAYFDFLPDYAAFEAAGRREMAAVRDGVTLDEAGTQGGSAAAAEPASGRPAGRPDLLLGTALDPLHQLPARPPGRPRTTRCRAWFSANTSARATGC